MLQDTLGLQEELLGETHPQTLTSMNNLAVALQAAGKLDQAVPLYEAVVAARRKTVRQRVSLDFLSSAGNLGRAYELMDRLGEATELYEEVLAGYAEVYGDEHEETLRSMVNLAVAYTSAGEHGQAADTYRRLHRACVSKLGEEHPSALRARKAASEAELAAAKIGGDDTPGNE